MNAKPKLGLKTLLIIVSAIALIVSACSSTATPAPAAPMSADQMKTAVAATEAADMTEGEKACDGKIGITKDGKWVCDGSTWVPTTTSLNACLANSKPETVFVTGDNGDPYKANCAIILQNADKVAPKATATPSAPATSAPEASTCYDDYLLPDGSLVYISTQWDKEEKYTKHGYVVLASCGGLLSNPTLFVQLISTPMPSAGPMSTPAPVISIATSAPAGNTPAPDGVGFTPDWNGLSKDCPSKDSFLKAHNLTADKVIFHPAPNVSWRKCQYVIEFKPQYYGQITIPQLNGWFYDDALADGTVTDMWGGDPNVPSVKLQWGFTATWGPANLDGPYKFVDPNNPCEILVEDARFGYYWRLPNIGLPPSEDPYYTRNGPYKTLAGNMYCPGWIPPEVDQTVPLNYLQAAAMFGGLANSEEWTHPDQWTWVWKYSKKVAGSATYCPTGMPCWQTVYVPQNSRGYVVLWVGNGPKKFYASDLSKLMLNNLNVDEFSAVTSNH